MDIPFEPTRSFCYRFSRNVVIPEILASADAARGTPFKLADVANRSIEAHLTVDQQRLPVQRAESNLTEPVARIIKGFVRLWARSSDDLIRLGDGQYRTPTVDDISDEELEDVTLDDGIADEIDFDGFIYAYSFPSLIRENVPFPIKVGRTRDDVEERVRQQCKGQAMFDNPQIVGQWQVRRVVAMEHAIHNVLRARGKWRDGAPGREWFNTTMSEVQSILDFIAASS